MHSNFPNGFSSGVLIRGMPILNVYGGNVFWVDSGSGLAGQGTFERPFTSIEAAFNSGKLTANNGDIVMVKAGHAETVSEAGGLDLDVAGVTIIGLGVGTSRPTITLSLDTADIDIDAANITIENVIFVAAYADIAAAIDVNSTDFSLIGCRFQESDTDLNALIWVQDGATTTSNRLSIIGCEAVALDAANTHFVNFAGTGDNCKVIGNTLIGDWGTMAIGGAGVITNCVITDNVIYNAASTSDACINLAATATGIVMRNLCGGAAAQANGVTATACAIAENYYGVISEDLSAILDPIAT